jgi:hypothetical protein
MKDEQLVAIIERLDAIKELLEAMHERSVTTTTLLGEVKAAIEDNTRTMTTLPAFSEGVND